MRRIRIAVALAMGVLWLSAAGPLGAQPTPEPGASDGPHDGPPGRFIAEHAEELGLSEETRAEIEGIVGRTHEQSRELQRAHHRAAEVLLQLLQLEEPDRSSVMNQAEVVGQLESQRRKLRLGAMLDIRSLLTPEQRRRLVELRPSDRSDWRSDRRFDWRPDRFQRRQRMRSCRPDAERLCTDGDRPRDILRCLRKNREELSDECGEALAELEEHRPRRHDR